jgi:NAD(P)-dependent dehydrogenase (short-subunit alcohol dehydrogenase family)
MASAPPRPAAWRASCGRRTPRIDVLANNAGGIMGARAVTKDGFEKIFQVNHLAPFLLTHLLMPALIPGQAKVLQTSSIAAQRYGHVDLDDLQNEKSYAPQKTYGTEGHRIRTQYPRSGAA